MRNLNHVLAALLGLFLLPAPAPAQVVAPTVAVAACGTMTVNIEDLTTGKSHPGWPRLCYDFYEWEDGMTMMYSYHDVDTGLWFDEPRPWNVVIDICNNGDGAGVAASAEPCVLKG